MTSTADSSREHAARRDRSDAGSDRLAGLDAHPHARAVLGAALTAGGRPSHAYLFHGPPGAGKRAVARAFAAALLAEGSPAPEHVAQRVARDAHPDLTWVRRSGAADMLVSDVDEAVVAAATRTPFESARRVFVLEGAETMNDQAANRLLKTLEEPASFVHLILIADRPQDLLPTIASRCQPVRFDPPSSEQIAAGLRERGVADDLARASARLSLGDARLAELLASPAGERLRAAGEELVRASLDGRAGERPWTGLLAVARAAGEAELEQARARLAADVEQLPARERRRHEREATEAMRRAERRARTSTLDGGLRIAGLWLRDAAALAAGADEIVHALDRLDQLRGLAAQLEDQRLREGVELVEDTRRRLVLNVSDELALEALSYRLAALANGPSRGSRP